MARPGPSPGRTRVSPVAVALIMIAVSCGSGAGETAAPDDSVDQTAAGQGVEGGGSEGGGSEAPLEDPPDPEPELDPVVTTEFTLFDTGEATTLSDFAGTPLVVNLWASWCPNCITEMPDFELVHQQFGDAVTFIGMNVDDDRARAEELRDATGVTYLLASDTEFRFQELLGAFAMPATAFVTASSEVADVWIGQLTAEKLAEQIEEHLLTPEALAVDPPAEPAGGGVAAASATADQTFDPEFLNLGPGARQFIPLDEPVLIEAAAATWLDPDDIVMGIVSADGRDIQAYPIDQMAYHHIANTRLAGEPFVVTY